MSGTGYSTPRLDDWMRQQAEQGKAPLVEHWLKSHHRHYVDARGEPTPPPTPALPTAIPSDSPGPSPAFSSGRLVPNDARLPVGMVRQLLRTVGEAPEDQQPEPSPTLDNSHFVPGASWPWESSKRTENSSQLLEPSGDGSGVDYGELFFGNIGLSPCIGTYTPNQGSTPHRTPFCKSDKDVLLPSLLLSSPPPPPPSLLRVSPSPVDTTRCWLTNLPGHLNYVGLFRSLRNAGRIAAASIYHHDHHHYHQHLQQQHLQQQHLQQQHHLLLNPHELEDPLPSSSVLLTFCRPTDCRRFVQKYRELPLCIDGRVARLEPVMDHHALTTTTTERAARAAAAAAADRDDEQHDAYGGRTRVLFVEGPAARVNREALRALAARNDVPEDATVLLNVVRLGHDGHGDGGPAFAHAEWQLAGTETQARPLHDALARLVGFRVRYASDPCEGRFRP